MPRRSSASLLVPAFQALANLAIPELKPVSGGLGPNLTKNRTFVARNFRDSGKDVYVAFDHSSKSWHRGWITVNVGLATPGAPLAGHETWPPRFFEGVDGFYRLGSLHSGKDKWWLLEGTRSDRYLPKFMTHWLPADPSDLQATVEAAAQDIVENLGDVLEKKFPAKSE